jgi:hypothetical protein
MARIPISNENDADSDLRAAQLQTVDRSDSALASQHVERACGTVSAVNNRFHAIFLTDLDESILGEVADGNVPPGLCSVPLFMRPLVGANPAEVR